VRGRLSLESALLISDAFSRFARKRMRITTMIFDYSLAGLVSLGLLFYLTYALLRPERF
jgi:K+-transporting ATPase KdpF subunit